MNQSDETKRCRHCQSEIPKKAKVCPECRKKQHGKLKWAILAVVIIGIGAAAGGSGNGQDEPLVQKVADLQDTGENQNADQNSSGAENGKKDTDKSGTKENGQTENDQKESGQKNSGQKDNGKPASGKKNNTENNGKADAEGKNDSGNIFVTGDVIETSGLRISFLSAEQYISDNEFIQPEKGHIYYKMSFEFENISDSDQYVSSFDFDCYADGYDMQQAYMDDALSLDATLSPGRKTKGSVIFEAPPDSKEILLEYETGIWTEDKIIFKIK